MKKRVILFAVFTAFAGHPLPADFRMGLGNAAVKRSARAADKAFEAGTRVDCTVHSQPYRTNASLAVDPSNHNIVYIGIEQEGFFKTIDGGRSWQRITNGIKAFRKKNGTGYCYDEFFQTAVAPSNTNKLCTVIAGSPGLTSMYSARNNGIYCSADGGANWTQMTGANMNAALISVAIDPSNPDIIYAGSNGNAASFTGANPAQYFNSAGVIYKSVNGGATWTELKTGFTPGMRVSDIRVSASNPLLVYASVFAKVSNAPSVNPAQVGVIKSIDGGNSWSSSTSGMQTGLPDYQSLTRMDLSPKNSSSLYVSASSVYQYYSLDGGGTFTRPQNQGGYLSVFAFDPNDAEGDRLLGTDPFQAGVYVSSDSGRNWSLTGTKPAEAQNNPVKVSDIEFSRQDPNIVYMSGSHGALYKSVDGGVSWSKILGIDTVP